jgi:nucleoside-diphosphate-sugar epimerase
MKVLFIGGTGNISKAVSKLAVEKGIDLYLLNRGNQNVDIQKAKSIVADINDASSLKELQKHEWDVVVNWIAFNTNDIKRDYELFKGKTKQYIFISSASAYQKPLSHPVITESTPLANPYWDYSRDKIACEEMLNKLYREKGFPITIVRPSLTYDTVIPLAICCWDDWTVAERILNGKEIIVQGDGTSLWTVTHAEDFAKGFVGLLGHQQAIGDDFHITSDELLTWNQINEAVAMALGAEANIVHIDTDFICKHAEENDYDWISGFMRGNLWGDKSVSTIFDNSKIKRFVPEFTATIPFKQGIKRTIDWFHANPEKKVIIDLYNKFIDGTIAAYRR